MNEEPKDIKSIFAEALEKKTAKERAAYLDKACGKDVNLRSKVEALLKAHDEAGDFLQVPALDAKVTLDESPLTEKPGTRIGRYKLLQLIGEGGFGVVYMAEQEEPIRRRVALKIIKLGMDTKQVIARFEAERQALALMDHPNIAHIFDAGTTETARPYFAMEYVKGLSITKYCDERKLNIEQRLRLFEQVCEAVHYAHQKGIIHRDIKPSNILVSVQADKAVPKIIDFGIAKALTQPLTEGTLFTQQGQLLGTPEYMSPEQVDMATQDIDIRSDIYSLGVILYELLAGVLPFEKESFERAGFAEIQQMIRELEPASPSVRLTSLGEKAKTIAESRGTQVIALARRLHRELEWIPLKAMRKDRCRRYRSASELADDVRNYLNGLPLIAGPETAVYQVRKFVRKHAGSVATTALVAAVIVLGLIVSTVMYFRAEQARQNESVARSQAEQAEKAAKEKSEELRRTLYVNSIQLADAKYGEANIRRVRELLESCPADLRGWEWNHLNYIADQALMTLRGHSDGVFGMAVSPDGKRIVSSGVDKTIRVWDVSTGNQMMVLKGHEGVVGDVAISPDGKRIVSVSSDKTAKVWDVATGSELMTLRGHDKMVFSVAFSPDGARIVTGGERAIRVWDAASGTEVMTLRGHKGGVWSAIFSPDGRQIGSASSDGTIRVWDVATGSELLTLRGHDKEVLSVVFSPDGKRIISGSIDGTVKMWEPGVDPTAPMTLKGRHNSMAFSPDGKHIVTGGKDETIRVWDAVTHNEVMKIDEAGGSVSFSPDGKRIISADGNDIKLCDASSGKKLMTLSGHEDTIWSMSYSPDGKRIVSGSKDSTLKVWDAESGAEVMTLRGHWSSVRSVAFSPDSKQVVSGSMDSTLKVWDAESGAELMTLRGHGNRVYSVAFSPDGKRIVSGSYDCAIKVWDAATGAELITLRGHERGVASAAFSPDGRRIVSGSGDRTLKVWDSASPEEVAAEKKIRSR